MSLWVLNDEYDFEGLARGRPQNIGSIPTFDFMLN